MKLSQKLLIAVVLLISTTIAKPTPWSTMFAQVSETNDFGKSMGSLIQMHITALDPASRLQEISELIKGIHTTMVEQNESEAERIASVRLECSTTIANLNTQLTNANGQLADNTAERSELLDEQSQKSVALREEKENYEGMVTDKAQAESDLETENEQFATKQHDFQSLIVACQSGIDLLTHMIHGEVNFGRNGESFIQLAQVKNNFATVLQQFKKHSSTALMEPLLNALISLSSKNQINYEEFLQCIELLHDILSRLQQDLTILTNRHNQIVEDLTTLITQLTDWISISGSIIEIYEERLREIETRLSELEGLIQEVNVLISALDSQLANTQADCTLSNEQYETAQVRRDEELSIMERLIEYFDSQVATTVGNVRSEALDF